MKLRYFSFIATASILAMASCTDDGPNEGNNPENPGQPSEGVQSLGNVPVNVYTDLSKFGGSIYNYNPFTGGSRAGENFPYQEEISEPKPADYADAQVLDVSSNNIGNGIYKIVESGTYPINFNSGAIVYICAKDVVLSGNIGNAPIFHVLRGASIKFADWQGNSLSEIAGPSLYLYEGLNQVNDLTKVTRGELHILGDIQLKNLEFSEKCVLHVDGTITAESLNFGSANVTVQAPVLNITESTSITNTTQLFIEEAMTVTGNLSMASSTSGSWVNCLSVSGDLTHANDGNIIIGSSVSAANLFMTSNGTLTLENDAVAKITGVIDFGSNVAKIIAENDDNANVVLASEFKGNMHVHNGEYSIQKYFYGNITLSDKMKLTNQGSGDKTEINPNATTETDGYVFTKQEGVKFSDVKTEDKADGCIAGSTNNPKPVPPVIPDVITEIRDHEHPISATCVALGPDNDFYLSWHKRGAGQVNTEEAIWGCIERLVYDPSENVVKLVSFMETDNAGSLSQHPVTYQPVDGAYDFNHIIYHNGKLYATGEHPKKGGFIAEINLPMGEWENNLNIMTARSLLGTKEKDGKGHGISGNCVVVTPEGKFLIADAGGYQEATRSIFDMQQRIDPESGKPVTAGGGNPVYDWVESLAIDKDGANPFKLTNGSAKHIAINGNMVATIEYTSRHTNEYNEDDATTTLPARISVYDQYTNWLGTPSWTAEVEEFAPIYGKNVIAVDNDGTVYSCQGKNGVAKYTAGSESARFDVSAWAENYSDDKGAEFSGKEKNVFAAAAANGLCIYGDYLFVAYGGAGVYVLDKNTLDVLLWYDTGGSANYVQVRDGIAYVAYGKSGAQVVNFKLNELGK